MPRQFRYCLVQEDEFEDYDDIPKERWSREYPKVFKTTERDKFGRMPTQTILCEDREVSEWGGRRIVDSVGGDYLDEKDGRIKALRRPALTRPG